MIGKLTAKEKAEIARIARAYAKEWLKKRAQRFPNVSPAHS